MVWTAIGESICGTSHRTRNTPCQDAHRFKIFGLNSEWLVIATADGAGSSSHSEIGSALACNELIQRVEGLDLTQAITRETVLGLFTDVRGALIVEAERINILPRELACTALLAIMGPEVSIFAQIGDGAIVYGDEQTFKVAFWPEPAEYVNTTDFLTDESFQDLIHFESLNQSISEVAVLTDGLQRLVLDFATRTAYSEFFRPIFHELRLAPIPENLSEHFRNFLDSERINIRTDDDKTLVLAVRQQCPLHPN